MIGKDIENPWGITTTKGTVRKLSSLIDSAVFPGIQGGPLEHIIAAKAVAFGEALSPDFITYGKQVMKNAKKMAEELVKRGYGVISGGTDNHSMLIDLRSKNITGKEAENALVKAHITVNKNMVPFDTQSPFVTSGIRLGTPAITSRGMKENEMEKVVELLDAVIVNHNNDSKLAEIKLEVRELMKDKPLFTWA